MSIQLDPQHYTQGEPFMREKTHVFAREWLPICAISQLSRSGDFLGHVIGGWPIVAVRDGERTRLFRNTCRHQSMMVLDKPAGNCSIMQCRYHGWQYQLNGTFVAAPPLVAPAPDSTGSAVDLLGLGVHRAGPLLFGHLRADAPPPALDESIAGALSGDPTAVSTVDIGCNWKVLAEHALANGLQFHWPLLAVRPMARGAQILQIIPRSFLRTRVVNYVIASADPGAAAEAAVALEQDRVACEALQARYAAGAMEPLISSSGGTIDVVCAQRIASFRRRVLDAIAAD